MPSFADKLRRIWQPRKGLFWAAVGLQVISSVLVMFIQVQQPDLGWRWVLALLALTNTLLGWWLLARLWREAVPE